MDAEQFREFGKAAVDYIADYLENLRDRSVLPSVEPGYLRDLVPAEAPEEGEDWRKIMQDMDDVIMPGVTHWHSPHFHAYYPTANSYPGIVGEMMSAGIACVGFNWITSPVCTELEVMMMDWLGKLIDLPEEFLNCSKGPGGGVIQGSASEATLICLLAAREKTVRRVKEEHPEWSEEEIRGKLVAYSSDQSNSSVEKSGLLGAMPMKLLKTDARCCLRGDTLREAVEQDRAAGLIPCYVVATLGTTGTCAFDRLEEIGPVCVAEGLWLHIDAAYAGSAFACPEYRYLMKGVEHADSFNFNPHKWMLVNFDCSAMWVKNSKYLVDAFNVDPLYLKNEKKSSVPDYRHWQIPLGRRFRALKLWFVLRIYGVEGIQKHIRKQIGLAKRFEDYVRSDYRFELAAEPSMGLVSFRVKGHDERSRRLNKLLLQRKHIYLIQAEIGSNLVLRFAVCSRMCEQKDIDFAWKEISAQTDEVLRSEEVVQKDQLILGDMIMSKCTLTGLESITEYRDKSKTALCDEKSK